MNLGAPEILLILVVALLVFGPHRLPEIGRQVGGAIRELRKMQDSVKSELNTALQEDQPRYTKPVSAEIPDTPPRETTGSAPIEEPDHTDRPLITPRDDGFDGPSGSFR